jgi:hypothetical protein
VSDELQKALDDYSSDATPMMSPDNTTVMAGNWLQSTPAELPDDSATVSDELSRLCLKSFYDSQSDSDCNDDSNSDEETVATTCATPIETPPFQARKLNFETPPKPMSQSTLNDRQAIRDDHHVEALVHCIA